MALRRVGVELVASGANTFNGALSQATNLTQRFGVVAQGATGGIEKMSVAAVALGTALGNLAAAGIGKIVEGIQGFISDGFQFNNTLEQATAKLIAFTGSGEAAAEVLEMVRRRAMATPFAFDEMANAAAGLAAVSKSTGADLEGLIGIAERLAAVNPAEGLEGAAFALREAFSGDFISLQDRFNLSKDVIARIKEAGVSVESFDLILGELGITTQLVTGLAETFQGRLSSFQDVVTGLASSLTLPIFDAFKSILMELTPIIEKNSGAISEFLTSIGEGIASNILSTWGFLRDAVITFQEALSGDWIDSDIVQPFHRVVGIAGTVIGQFGLLGEAFGRLMDGKPIDSYIEAIVRNISEMLGLDLTNFEFDAIIENISGAIETALEWVWRFNLAWALLNKTIEYVKDVISSQWFVDNIETPLRNIGDFLANEFKLAWDGFILGIQTTKSDLDTLNESTASFQSLIMSVNGLMASLNTYYGLWATLLGVSSERSKDNNKQMGEMITLGGILDGIFRGLTAVVLGWTSIVQSATNALITFIGWVQTAYNNVMSLIGAIQQGAGIFGEAYPTQPVDPIVGEAQSNMPAPKQTGSNTTKAPATGLMSPANTSGATSSSVTVNVTVQGGGGQPIGAQARDGTVDALRAAGLM